MYTLNKSSSHWGVQALQGAHEVEPGMSRGGVSCASSMPDGRAVDYGHFMRDLKGDDRCAVLEATIGGDELVLVLVADGHGGSAAAQHVCDRLLRLIVETASDGSCEALQVAVVAGFEAMHRAVRESGSIAGTTLTVASLNLTRRQCCLWNVGDSLAMLLDGASGEAHALGSSHRLNDDAAELRRVVALGARIGRARDCNGKASGPLRAFPGGTSLTRSIGDADCGDFVSCEPASVLGVQLPVEGGAVVVGSDGVWDQLSLARVAATLLSWR